MVWLCARQEAAYAQVSEFSFVFWVWLASVGLVYAMGVLPRVYRHRRDIFGGRATYGLGNISNQELREAGLAWAIWLRRFAVLTALAFWVPVALLPTVCSAA